MVKSIEIDRKKRLREEPGKGHNRWHPDIALVIEAAPGEEVTLETRDANDLQIHAGTTANIVPVAVDGALYSVGDGHYAQGDSECCGTAIDVPNVTVSALLPEDIFGGT